MNVIFRTGTRRERPSSLPGVSREVPQALLAKLKTSDAAANRKFAIADGALDAATTGPSWLSHPDVADVVQSCLLRGARELNYFDLFAHVVMPNHVHVLLEPKLPLQRLTRGIKGHSSQLANRILGRVGQPFWQDESFDHWGRRPSEVERIIQYIENNPVKAGLATNASAWPWSSASPLVAQAFLPVQFDRGKNSTG